MAEISPELAARIEELRIKHEENPAKFFMSLANAYREAGQLGEAESLLREHLKRHPGYLSAHVLLGGCLADRGARDEARNEFHYVLSIDPQNLIALRTLADMAAAEGNRDEARRWYNEWLAVDPMSGEARRALEALDAPAPASEAATEGETGWDPFAHGEVGGGVEEAGAPSPGPAAGGFGEVDLPATPREASAPAGESLPEPTGFGEIKLPADLGADLQPSGAATGDERADAAPAPEPEALDLPPWGEVRVDEPAEPLPEAGPAAGEPAQQPAPASVWADWTAESGIDLPPEGTTTPPAAAPLEEPVGVAAPAAAPDEQPGEPAAEVTTETMAELLYRQGHLDRAADVYRELLMQRGHEPALARRLSEIEAEMRGEVAAASSGTEAEEAWDGRQGGSAGGEPPAWLDAVDAVATGVAEGLSAAPKAAAPAPSVVQYLTSLLRWRPAAPPAAATTGEPSAAAPAPKQAESAAEDLPWMDTSPAAAVEQAPSAGRVEDAAPAEAMPWDEQTLDAPEVQPPLDEPWIAPGAGAAATGLESAARDPFADSFELGFDGAAAPAAQAAPPAEAEPAASVQDGAAVPEEEPWSAPALESLSGETTGSADEPLPWAAPGEPAATPGAEEAPRAAPVEQAGEPMPWETGPPAGGESGGTPPPATGGFSFEDFFTEPPPEAPAAPPAPEATAAPPAAGAPATPSPGAAPSAPAGDEDEDLESFQAWLQSLKR